MRWVSHRAVRSVSGLPLRQHRSVADNNLGWSETPASLVATPGMAEALRNTARTTAKGNRSKSGRRCRSRPALDSESRRHAALRGLFERVRERDETRFRAREPSKTHTEWRRLRVESRG